MKNLKSKHVKYARVSKNFNQTSPITQWFLNIENK